MTDCLFCKIVSGDIPAQLLYQDDKVVVFKDIAPKADVHLLVVPIKHIVSLDSMKADDDVLMAHMMRLLPVLAKEQGLESGFRTIINTGKGGGQEVMHLHIHLMGGNNLPGFD